MRSRAMQPGGAGTFDRHCSILARPETGLLRDLHHSWVFKHVPEVNMVGIQARILIVHDDSFASSSIASCTRNDFVVACPPHSIFVRIG